MALENDNNDGNNGGGDPAPNASAADLIGGGGGSSPAPTPPAGDPPAGDPPANDPPAGDPPSGADPDWYAELPTDADGDKPSLRDWVASVGAKDPASLAKMARDSQAALRAGGSLKVPGEGASEQEITDYHKAIGVPDDAKGYELPAPKDADGNAIPLNTPMLERIAENAHKAGVPKGALEKILGEEVQAQQDEIAAAETDLVKRADAHVKQWGGEKDVKMAAVDNALNALGLNRDQSLALRAALGPETALDMFARLGAGLSEDKLMGGGEAKRFGVSATEAKAEMETLKKDKEFQKKVMVPGSAERLRWNRLQDAIGAAADREAASG